jgi:hypothetical protein
MSGWRCGFCKNETCGCEFPGFKDATFSDVLVYDYDVFKEHTKALEIQRDQAIKERDEALKRLARAESAQVTHHCANCEQSARDLEQAQTSRDWRYYQAVTYKDERDEAREQAVKYKKLYDDMLSSLVR